MPAHWHRISISNGARKQSMAIINRKTVTPLISYDEIKRGLALGAVYCDITSPAAMRIPVRDVRKFKPTSLDKLAAQTSQSEWTARFNQGNVKGYEVLVLEGWHVPERVYRETVK